MGLVFAEPQMAGLQALGIHHLFNREKMNGSKGIECSPTPKNEYGRHQTVRARQKSGLFGGWGAEFKISGKPAV